MSIILDINKNNYFYCAECESKTKIVPYFRTWCTCKESSIISTLYETQYFGCAVSEYNWKQMEIPDAKIVFYPTTTPIHEL